MFSAFHGVAGRGNHGELQWRGHRRNKGVNISDSDMVNRTCNKNIVLQTENFICEHGFKEDLTSVYYWICPARDARASRSLSWKWGIVS
jgi:hypothetical protein